MTFKMKCVECGNEFEATQSKAKFCGPACYREGMRKLNRVRNRGKEYRKKTVYPAVRRWQRKRR